MTWLESKLGRLVAGLGVLVFAFGFGFVKGNAHGKAMTAVQIATIQRDAANAEASAERAARSAEQAQAARNTKIDAAYQRGLEDAKATADWIVAGFGNGNVKLRPEWRGCPAAARVPAPAATVTRADAAADVRTARDEQVHREIAEQIRESAEADALIKALQARIRSDIETVNGSSGKP